MDSPNFWYFIFLPVQGTGTRDRSLTKPQGPWPAGVGGRWNPKNHWISLTLYSRAAWNSSITAVQFEFVIQHRKYAKEKAKSVLELIVENGHLIIQMIFIIPQNRDQFYHLWMIQNVINVHQVTIFLFMRIHSSLYHVDQYWRTSKMILAKVNLQSIQFFLT